MNVPKGFRNRDRYPISSKHDDKYKTVKYQLLLLLFFYHGKMFETGYEIRAIFFITERNPL